MAEDVRQIVTLFVFFGALALCMWRWPKGDRWHLALCGVAAVLWIGLLFLEPRTRTFMYGVIVGNFLTIGLARRFSRRFDLGQ